jgi:predicted ATPase
VIFFSIFGCIQMNVEYMYNDSYGGFRIPDNAVAEYVRRKSVLEPNYVALKFLNRQVDRTDALMIQVLRDLKITKVAIKSFPKKYEPFIEMDEYDGMENVQVNFERYKISMIENVIASEKDSDKQITKIKKILAETQE